MSSQGKRVGILFVSKRELPRGCFFWRVTKEKRKVWGSLWHSLGKIRKGAFVLVLFGVERVGLIKKKTYRKDLILV